MRKGKPGFKQGLILNTNVGTMLFCGINASCNFNTSLHVSLKAISIVEVMLSLIVAALKGTSRCQVQQNRCLYFIPLNIQITTTHHGERRSIEDWSIGVWIRLHVT